MTAFTLVYVPEELETSVLFHASLKDAGCTLAHQLIVDNCVCSGSATDLPRFSAVFLKDSIHQEISNRLCPRWRTDDYHYHCLLRYCFRLHLGLLDFRLWDLGLWNHVYLDFHRRGSRFGGSGAPARPPWRLVVR